MVLVSPAVVTTWSKGMGPFFSANIQLPVSNDLNMNYSFKIPFLKNYYSAVLLSSDTFEIPMSVDGDVEMRSTVKAGPGRNTAKHTPISRHSRTVA